MSGRIVLKGKRSIKVGPTSLPMETADGASVTLEDCVSAHESFPNSSGGANSGSKPDDKAPCLAVPKRSKYERRRSPLAGDESPMDGLVVHPETFQAEPAQGFAEGDGTASGNMDEEQKEDVSDHGLLRANSSKRPSTPSLLERKKTKVTLAGRERQHSTTTSSSDDVFHSSLLGSTMSHSGGVGSRSRLSTSAARKGGRTVSADTEWSFDGLTQLHSFFPDGELTVFVGTWNMAEIKDLPPSLDDFLLPLTHEAVADICVVGTQECGCDVREWEVLLQQTLGPSHVLVHSRQMGALHMVAFIRRDLLWHCSAVRSDSFSTKPGTPLRTKGGIGLCLSIFGSSFLFINCHLTAYDEKVAERNSDVAKISANLAVCLDDDATDNNGDVCSHFDYVLWCGDLNYRVDLARKETQAMLEKADYMSLLLQDQLTKEILKGKVFQGFSEQPINFPPSYKYDFHSNDYDSSEKQRIPSWTDRILFKSNNGGRLHGMGYNSCQSILHSDHRPVYGVFRAALSPSSALDSIPNQIATFDVDVYNQANSQRKTMAATTLALRKQRSSSLHDASSGSQHAATAFCTVL